MSVNKNSSDQVKDFLGVGIGFPWKLKNEKVAWAEYEESIRQSILIILGTNKGERLMRPDFGSDLRLLVFAPITPATLTQAQFIVEDALKKWEPRIELIQVSAEADRKADNKIDILIEYRAISTNTTFNLVYPFYLEKR